MNIHSKQLQRFLLFLSLMAILASAWLPVLAADLAGAGDYLSKGNIEAGLVTSYTLTHDKGGWKAVEGSGSAYFSSTNTITCVAQSNYGGSSWYSSSDQTSVAVVLQNNSANTMTLKFTLTQNTVANGATCTVVTSNNAVDQDSSSNGYSFELTAKATCTITLKASTPSTSTAQQKITISGISLEMESASITFHPANVGSYKVGGTKITKKEILPYGKTTTITLSAPAGYEFAGWMYYDDNGNSTHKFYTYDQQFAPTGAVSVAPIFVPKGSATYLVGSEYYFFLDEAATVAQTKSIDKIIVVKNGTVPKGTYTIPENITLLIPRDGDNTLYTTKPGFDEGTYVTPSVYRTLTLADGATIYVNGAISVAGMQSSSATGAPTGALGHIALSEGSQIIANSGSNVYVWGIISGEGSVTMESGSTVYQNFQIADWRGGQATSGMLKNEEKVFPLSQYYVQNVEAELVLKAGAICRAHTCMSIKLVGLQTTEVVLVGSSTVNGLFKLNDGYLTMDYDGPTDRMIVGLHGDVSLSSVSLTLKVSTSGQATIDSADYILPITSNYTVNIESGSDVTLTKDFALIPGSQVNVKAGGTLTLADGATLYVYDQDDWKHSVEGVEKGFVGSASEKIKVIKWTYANGNKAMRNANNLVDAALCVNGTVDASGGNIYTTTGGANIYSTGAGQIITNDGEATQTHQAYQYQTEGILSTTQNIDYIPIGITEAQLKNGNPTKPPYTQTTGSSKTTYTYCLHCGMWYTGTHTCVTGWLTNVSLANNLHMYFAYQTDLEAGNLTASVTHYYADGSVVTTDGYTLEQGTINGNQYLRLTYTGVAAKEMVDAVYVTLYDSTGKAVAFWGDSIEAYALRLYDLSTTSDKLKTVIVDMLNYGAACQVQFQYNTGNLANKGLDSTLVKEYVQKPGNALDNDLAAPSITIAQRNLEVTSSIRFHVAFNGNVAGKTATVTLTGHKGNSITQTPTVDSNGCIEITDLVVADYDCEITITIDGTTMKTKISHYLNDLGGTDTDNVFYAFMEFAASAYDYLHTRGGTQ